MSNGTTQVEVRIFMDPKTFMWVVERTERTTERREFQYGDEATRYLESLLPEEAQR